MATGYNTDFKDLMDTITPEIYPTLRELGWVSFTNGYYEDRNDTYMVGFRMDGSSFPFVLTLKFHFPWSFHEWSGKSMKSDDYHKAAGGGFLAFDKEFNFEFLVDTFMFRSIRGDFKPEPDEFEHIQSEKFTIDKSHLEKTFKQFTKKDFNDLNKWIKKAIPLMQQRIDKAIGEQVGRRFSEVMDYNEDLAMKYVPKTLEELFIF